MSGQTNGASASKKLVIKPFKQTPKLREQYEAKFWQSLDIALQAVYNKTPLQSISKEELYRIVEDLCIDKKSLELYNYLDKRCRLFVEDRVNKLLKQTSLDSVSFIRAADELWLDHCDIMTTVRNIFIYLDRSYALPNSNVKSVWELSLHYLRQNFNENSNLEGHLCMGLLASIETDRQGHVVDEDRIQRLLRMFIALGIYKDKFEVPMLEDARRFFSSEGRAFLGGESVEWQCDIAQFLEHVERRIIEAKEMVTRYLDVSTKQPLIQVIESCLFAPHVPSLLEKGLNGLLANDRHIDLKRFYNLTERVSLHEDLKRAWVAYLRSTGESLISEEEKREKTLIDDLLQLQDRSEAVLKFAFDNNENFRQAYKAAMIFVSNIKSSRVAELLARFIDRKLRGEKGMQETDTEQSFDKVISLFKLIQGKDVFEAFYKKLLAKRLLLGKSASYELERTMLSRLKTECGSGFTSKLDGMFQDIDLSRDTMASYSAFCSQQNVEIQHDREPETAIQVLTTGFWPSCPMIENLMLPTELIPVMTRFDNFYRSKYSGRRLQWAHALGRCVVVARFKNGSVKKELEVSFFQALVLLCFKDNSVKMLPFEQIKAQTGLEDGELRRTLASLACGLIGTRVLTKHPKGKDVENGDSFHVNEDFNNKLYRIKVNTIQLKETVEEVEKTHEEIFRERLYQVDAAIVRIMKARKRLQHNILMSELLSQLKFPARPPDIKQRIESLIEREYLERDKDDAAFYNYKA